MDRNKMSSYIKSDVQDYLEYLLAEQSNRKADQQEYLEAMPPTLQKKVLSDLNSRPLIECKPFISNFTIELIRKLATKLDERTLGPGEVIYKIKEREKDSSFFVIVRGQIKVYFERTGQTAKILGNGDHFGDISFFSDRENTTSAKSYNYSRVFNLDKKDFREVIERFPEQKEIWCQIKDKINLYNDYSDIHITCIACNRKGHHAIACNFLHYNPDPVVVVQMYLHDQQSFREKFVRRNKTRFHALTAEPELIKATQKIIVNHFIVDPSPQEFNPSKEIEETIKNIKLSEEKMPKCLAFLTGSYPYITQKFLEAHGYDLKELKNPELLRQKKKDHEKRKNTVLDLDKVKNFRHYFTHNNATHVLKYLNEVQNQNLRFGSLLKNLEDHFIFADPVYIGIH